MLINRSVASGGGAISGAVTGNMMDNFHTFIQYTSAAYCNSNPAQMNTKIACGGNACPDIQTHDTHIVTTLEYVASPTDRTAVANLLD